MLVIRILPKNLDLVLNSTCFLTFFYILASILEILQVLRPVNITIAAFNFGHV